MFRTLGLAFLAAALASPAASHAAALEPARGSYLRLEDHRIATVSYRLLTRGSRFCSRLAPQTGMAMHQLAEYAPRDRAEANRQFRLVQGPGVLSVVDDSPAARAGLKAGDTLLSANGRAFPAASVAAAEADEKKRRRLIEEADLLLEEQLRLGPARLTLLRDGRTLELVLASEPGCASRGRLARSGQANAFADGRYAVMTTKLLGFMRNDDELAVAMAHELAHNILGHPAELDSKKVPKGILRNFGKNAARVHATEVEADRLGLKLLWAAGYEVSAAIPFWRRLYATYDPIGTPKLFRTHPSLGARERLINETIAGLGRSASETGPN